MVVVSHLFFFLRKYFRGRCDSGESHRPLSGTIYFPTAPFFIIVNPVPMRKLGRQILAGKLPHFLLSPLCLTALEQINEIMSL